MKKISLKNVKETLSRKEMRAIAGGYGGGRTGNCGDECYNDDQCGDNHCPACNSKCVCGAEGS